MAMVRRIIVASITITTYIVLPAILYNSDATTALYVSPPSVTRNSAFSRHSFAHESYNTVPSFKTASSTSLHMSLSPSQPISLKNNSLRRKFSNVYRRCKKTAVVGETGNPLLGNGISNVFIAFQTAKHFLRRAMTILFVSSIIFLSTTSFTSPPTHASSTSVSTTSTTVTKDKSREVVDRLVDKYIKKRMFLTDDVFDPMESAYREVYDDIKSGEYPLILSTTATDFSDKSTSEPSSPSVKTDDGLGQKMAVLLNKVSSILEKRLGLSKETSLIGTIMLSFSSFIFAILYGVTYYSNSQRLVLNKGADKKYGNNNLNVEEEEDDDD